MFPTYNEQVFLSEKKNKKHFFFCLYQNAVLLSCFGHFPFLFSFFFSSPLPLPPHFTVNRIYFFPLLYFLNVFFFFSAFQSFSISAKTVNCANASWLIYTHGRTKEVDKIIKKKIEVWKKRRQIVLKNEHPKNCKNFSDIVSYPIKYTVIPPFSPLPLI